MDRFNFALLCCLAVFTLNVHAANNYEYVDGRWTRVSVTQKSIPQARFTATYYHSFPNLPAEIAKSVPANKALPVTYSGSRVTQMARAARDRTPVAMAVAGAIAGAGWVIDELTGEVTQTTTEHVPAPHYQPGYYWRSSSHNLVGLTPASVADQWWASHSLDAEPCRSGPNYIQISATRFRPNRQGFSGSQPTGCTSTGINIDLTTCSGQSICNEEPQTVPVITTTPVTQQQLDQKIIPTVLDLPNHQIEESLRDAHGNPRPTPELMDALRDWLSDVAGRDPNLNYDPNTNRLTYTNPNTGTQTDYEPSTPTDVATDPTESYESAPGSDWPDFCSWATVVCDWLEWTREFEDPEIEDMPFREVNLLDYQQDYDSGLGQGICPAGVQYEFMGQIGSFDYTNACYVASNYFKPVLLFIGAFIAVMIIAGTNRSTS